MESLRQSGPVDVLYATIGYPPSQVGGTEIYVQGLAEELSTRSWKVAVLCFDDFAEDTSREIRVLRRDYNEIPVVRVGMNTSRIDFSSAKASSENRLKFANQFIQIFEEIKPRILHVHPLRLFVFAELIEHAKSKNVPVVFTFHSSTTTCLRGDLLYMGREDCNGEICQTRCSACMLNRLGLPPLVANLLAYIPISMWKFAHSLASSSKALRKLESCASIPLSVPKLASNWETCTKNADVVVAVCDWVKNACLLNGVSEDRLVASRHGLRIESRVAQRPPNAPVVLGYLGRCSPEKGIRVLTEALKLIPRNLPFEFQVCSATLTKEFLRTEEADEVRALRELAELDNRVRLLPAVSDEELSNCLASWDALVVPSLWFESGPQTVYESFAVQTPVIGSNRGGVAELVVDGKTGFLFPPGDAQALSKIICNCVKDVSSLRNLRQNIPPQRQVADVVTDMEQIYASVLSDR